MLPECRVDFSEIVQRHALSRIQLRPDIIDLSRFFQVTSNKMIVMSLDVELLPFAHVPAQFKCRSRSLGCQHPLSEVGICRAEIRVGHCKLRIKLNGMLEQRHCSHIVTLDGHSVSP